MTALLWALKNWKPLLAGVALLTLVWTANHHGHKAEIQKQEARESQAKTVRIKQLGEKHERDTRIDNLPTGGASDELFRRFSRD